MSQATNSPSTRSRWEKIITTGLIVVGVFLIVFFGLRAARSFLRIQFTGLEPGVTDVEQIRGWMTIPYIARAYGVPEEYIFEKLQIPPEGSRKKSLGQLNREYASGRPRAIFEATKAIIKQYQAEHPPPLEADHD